MTPRYVFIGVGGNSYGPLQLGLYLTNHQPNAHIVIVDGKEYRPSQKDHEFFLRHGPKAHVQALLLQNTYHNLAVTPVTSFVTAQPTPTTIGADDLLQDGDHIILVVDNHETRNLITHAASKKPNITLISGAIDGEDVGIWIYLRRNGTDITTNPLDRYPDINAATGGIPPEALDREGCLEEELTTNEERPNYFALLTTTVLTLNALATVIAMDRDGRINEFPYEDTWLNVRTATATPNRRTS